ncbi:hypothetical protein GAU_1803 [Gemmatimonas aurantiaca T-27]|uniref:Uncharacterized protein n=1 Tax=Gemmatimonas aurantiaca (strain DSM 14586 / JCM 11422 / NBRC 100505 / T-27) TaxID=379066 RepID=C1A420_GEMAT|nr:hypothetical protein [Gemmatimonas aurantiaca]BAH38845.1 hypothetical protein GAU_1803 [Gemmatimonas aurantiaca T-27]
MRFREVPFTTAWGGNNHIARHTGQWEHAHHERRVFSTVPNFAALGVSAEDEDAVFALKATPLEPAPPEPVVRDATWDLVHDVLDDAYEAGRGTRTVKGWLGLQDATDAILRAVRGEKIVRVLDGWYNLDADKDAFWYATAEHCKEVEHWPRPITDRAVRLAVLAEGAEAKSPVSAEVPMNCRQRLQHEGKPYPRSHCQSCGTFAPRHKECTALLAPGGLLAPAETRGVEK